MPGKIADRVAESLNNTYLSNKKIAKEMNISSTTVWRWKNKKTERFDEEELKSLAKVLRISYEWLQHGEGNISDDPRLNEIESRKAEKGESYKGVDQILLGIESRADNLRRDLQVLIEEIQKLRKDSD